MSELDDRVNEITHAKTYAKSLERYVSDRSLESALRVGTYSERLLAISLEFFERVPSTKTDSGYFFDAPSEAEKAFYAVLGESEPYAHLIDIKVGRDGFSKSQIALREKAQQRLDTSTHAIWRREGTPVESVRLIIPRYESNATVTILAKGKGLSNRYESASDDEIVKSMALVLANS